MWISSFLRNSEKWEDGIAERELRASVGFSRGTRHRRCTICVLESMNLQNDVITARNGHVCVVPRALARGPRSRSRIAHLPRAVQLRGVCVLAEVTFYLLLLI